MLKNVCETEAGAKAVIGNDLITRFQYYRSVRNWVVHPKDRNVSKPTSRFDEIVPYSEENKAEFGAVQAPNTVESLTFDDFILFSRLTKAIADRICQTTKPSDGHWLSAIDMTRFRRLLMKPERLKHAIAGRLRTDYGLDEPTAKWIAQEIQRNETH